MRKSITENGIEYRLTGDYYLPNLTLPKEPDTGYWGELRRKFLRERNEGIYTGMLLAGTLWPHLHDINTQAEQMMETIIDRMKATEGVTETLKTRNQMEWVRRMTNIHSRAKEIVLNGMICT